MSEVEYNTRLYEDSTVPRVSIDTDKDSVKCIAYIGSGTIIKDNHILTVRHLFDETADTYANQIWVFIQSVDHPIRADLVAITEEKTKEDYHNDYAVIQMREDIGYPGIPIAKKDVRLGEKVMFGCSVGGAAYFLRFGFASHWKWFFRKASDGVLHLSKWTAYHLTTTYPSGPGDSGSSVFNIRGEIVGVSYIGTNIYEEMYCFSNPVGMLWDFLKEHHLEYLGQ
jgi:S1-C subfamily serine protease